MSTAPLPANADPTAGPNHVAIIMDGNGRWAKARGLPRVAGHRRGDDAVRRVVRGAGELGIPVLTLFAFSTENWTRPADEVNDLMGLLRHYLRNELDELRKNGARLRVIGDREGLASDIVRDISDAENMTRGNSRIDVNICINYGARAEILQAIRSLARPGAAGELSAASLGPLLLATIWFGFPWIDLVAALAAPLMVSEWIRLTRGRPFIRILAVLYALAAVVALLWLRHQPALGRETIVWIVLCIWATDIGAYVVGRAAGGAKLAPRISPSKTWSGLVGGMAWAAVASAAVGYAFGLGETISLAMIGAGLAGGGPLRGPLVSGAQPGAGARDRGAPSPGAGGCL